MVSLPVYIVDYQYVLENISKKKHQIIDARSPGRFLGIDQEPRPDMKSGHIPNSKNLFFNDLIDQNSKKIIEKNKIEDLLKSSDIDKDVLSHIKSSGKPFMEYPGDEDYIDAYQDFYEQFIEQEETVLIEH